LEEVAAARLVVPEAAVELERLAAVLALEEAARDRADVDAALGPELHRPELQQRRGLERRSALARPRLGRRRREVVARAGGVLDLRRVRPRLPVVGRARDLRAPVPVAEQRPQRARVRVARGVVDAAAAVPRELGAPAALALRDREDALAGADED